MNKFAQMMADERQRQIEAEGYTPEHDDEHTDGSIADAAACYASSWYEVLFRNNVGGIHELWPWAYDFFKKNKKTRKQQLITAGALIIAELERLERAGELE